MKRYAAIDIGSQTIRLLIAGIDDETLYPLERYREIVRLGSGMQADALLQPDRIEHAVGCIRRFCEQARMHGVSEILAVATACVRAARNRQEFIERVHRASGICPAVISGEQEARLSLAGVQAVMATDAPSAVIIDIGGGSTELSFLQSGRLTGSVSLPLGVIAPAERFMRTDPPSNAEITDMRCFVRSMTAPCLPPRTQASAGTPPAAVATAGTATTLAAMDLKLRDYSPSRINAHVLTNEAITGILETMIKLPLAVRSQLPGLEPGRAAVIIPGAMILQHLLGHFGCDGCIVSDAGLLEGILIQNASLAKIIEKA